MFKSKRKQWRYAKAYGASFITRVKIILRGVNND